jgi:hypothetical protein
LGIEGIEDDTTTTCHFEFRDAERTPPLTIKRTIDPQSGAIALEAQPQEDGDEFKEKVEEIRQFLAAHLDPRSKNDICKEVGGKRDMVLKTVNWMMKQGIVRTEGKGVVLCQL